MSSDYWGIPEKEHEISLLQFEINTLQELGYTLISEKLEICSGAGALTLTAIFDSKYGKFGLYLNNGPKKRKLVLEILKLIHGINNAEELRNFILLHQHDFCKCLKPDSNFPIKEVRQEMKKIYLKIYDSMISDIYKENFSDSAYVLKKRLIKLNRL